MDLSLTGGSFPSGQVRGLLGNIERVSDKSCPSRKAYGDSIYLISASDG